jgi:putative membrane protein
MFWPQHMTNWGWGGMLMGGLMMLLFWGGFIALLIFAIRAFTTSGDRAGGKHASGKQAAGSESALDILKTRYARGEVGKEEYDAIRQDLET